MDNNRELLEIYDTICDVIDDHFLVCDVAGKVIFANSSMLDYLSYSQEEIKDKNLVDLLSDSHREKIRKLLAKLTRKFSIFDQELLFFNKKNDAIPLNVNIFLKKGNLFIFGNEKYVEFNKLQNKIKNETKKAGQIHKFFLPGELPKPEGLEFAAFFRPADTLGGDIYDVFKVDNGMLDDFFEQYIIFLADVSGHGLDSALISIFVRETIKKYFEIIHGEGQVLSTKEIIDYFIEQYLIEGYPEDYFVCMFIGAFDLKMKELTYTSAGLQNAPLLVNSEGRIEELLTGGLPISSALDTDLMRFEETVLELQPGMNLLFTTDGLAEQEENGSFYIDCLNGVFRENKDFSAEIIVENIIKDFFSFSKGENNDDITMLVAKVNNELNK